MDIKILFKQIIQVVAGVSLLLFISMVIVVACSSCGKIIDDKEYSDIEQVGKLYARGIYTTDYYKDSVTYKVFIFDDNIFVINSTKDSLEIKLLKKQLNERRAEF